MGGLGPDSGACGSQPHRPKSSAEGPYHVPIGGSAGPSTGSPLRLPADEFSYIGRPAETFEGRWAAIEEVLAARFGGSAAFSLVDVGSNHGYFALSAALRFPAAEVVGVEGSVGIGNGVVGSCTRSASRIVATEAIRTHLRWVDKLGLGNCFVAPEVWDLDRVMQLQEAGMRADAMLTLSVVHHIDDICQAAYSCRGLNGVDGSLTLLAGILRLADTHVVELPDRPWLEHLHERFGSPGAIIEAAVARTGEEWELRQIYRNDWLGVRELWLVQSRRAIGTAPRGATLGRYFPALLPGSELAEEALEQDAAALPPACADAGGEADCPGVPGDAAFAALVLCGCWQNAYGVEVKVSGQPPQLQCLYAAGAEPGGGLPRRGELRSMVWDGHRWGLQTAAGDYVLQSASEGRLTWRERSRGWSTEWRRL